MNRCRQSLEQESWSQGAYKERMSSNAAINSIATSYYRMFGTGSGRGRRLVGTGRRVRKQGVGSRKEERRSTGQMIDSETFPFMTNSRIHSMSPLPQFSPPRSRPTSQRASPSRTPSFSHLSLPPKPPTFYHGMNISPLRLPKPRLPDRRKVKLQPHLPVYQSWKKRQVKEKQEELYSPWGQEEDTES